MFEAILNCKTKLYPQNQTSWVLVPVIPAWKEAEARGFLSVRSGQPGLHSVFQESLGYKVRSFLKRNKNKQTKRKQNTGYGSTYLQPKHLGSSSRDSEGQTHFQLYSRVS